MGMKLGLALIAAVALVAVLVVLNLRTFVAVERDQMIGRAERALGRTVHVESVAPSWWPLGVRMRRIRVDDDPQFGSAALVEVPAVVIPLRLSALVRGSIELAGVRIEAPRLRLVRDARGRWNVGTLGRATGRPRRARRP